MDCYIEFEELLFFEESPFKDYEICDLDFWVEKILQLPSLRPFSLEKTIRICAEYIKIADFRHLLLEKSNICPIIVYHLFKRGVFGFEEIKPIVFQKKS